MARYRVYLKPFLDSGVYASDFTEITDDVVKLGNIQESIDNNDFDVGLVRNNGLSLTLRNDTGKYNEANDIRSIFRSRRKDSIVRVTWDAADYPLICGFFYSGNDPLGGEETIFEGLLTETTSVSEIVKQDATFKVLGYESLLDQIEVPFSSIVNGDLFSDIVLECLDQAPFNTLIDVDALNINLGTDLAIDDKSDYETKTVGEVLGDLLLASNSVLYLKSNTVYVTARTPSVDLKKTFYGQASLLGIENIITIPKIRDGLNRVFNFWNWEETTLVAKDTSSISIYGIKKKIFKTPIINNNSKIQAILDANRDEFSFPKLELEITSPMDYDLVDLQILDRVTIDHPTIYSPFDGGILPRYGLDAYGAVRYPFVQTAFTLTTDTEFKVLSKKVDSSKDLMTLIVREI